MSDPVLITSELRHSYYGVQRVNLILTVVNLQSTERSFILCAENSNRFVENL